MGLIDAFAKEDRVEVTFSAFYELMKGCAEREFWQRELNVMCLIDTCGRW